MIIGAHSIIYSTKPEQDRAFLRDVLKLPFVDPGGGWLIFELPPSEVAVHDSEKSGVEEFYLMCDDIDALVAEMREKSVKCGKIQRRPWGLLVQLALPGGGRLKIYQPEHARPELVKGPTRTRLSAASNLKKQPSRSRGRTGKAR